MRLNGDNIDTNEDVCVGETKYDIMPKCLPFIGGLLLLLSFWLRVLLFICNMRPFFPFGLLHLPATLI